MNSLYHDLMGGASSSSPRNSAASGVPPVIQQAAAQGFSLNVNDFMRFASMLNGNDPAAIIRELRDSGQMSDAQFNELKTKAQGFINLLKLVLPKK